MDNPWGTSVDDPGSEADPWARPKAFGAAHDDSEADLAMPSWSTSVAMHWDDPPESQGGMWVPTSGENPGWSTSTYDDITLQAPRAILDEPAPSPSPPTFDDAPQRQSLDFTRAITTDTPDLSLTTVEPFAISTESFSTGDEHTQTAPDSPDAFGTFSGGDTGDSAGFEVENIGSSSQNWPQSADAFGAGSWGGEWATEGRAEEISAPVDEWEAAKLEKLMQDSRVPPEVLAALMQTCEETCNIIWPSGESSENSHLDGAPKSLEDIPSLVDLFSRMAPKIPPMQPPLHFARTQTAKEMSSALKLTRNLTMNQKSPLAHFLMSSKGSSSWEASLKTKRDVTEDTVPIGWRIVERKEEGPEAAKDQAKMKTGGFLSFWNRRASSIPQEVTAASASNHDAPKAGGPARAASPHASSPRPSSSARTSVDLAPVKETSIAEVKVVTPDITMMTPSNGPDFFTPEDLLPEAEKPSPSAVSRFLNRFSRTPSGRKSVSLSAGDLDFLNEVPSAADDHTISRTSISGADAQTRGLEAMIKSDPIFAGPLPPALPPPPKSTPPIKFPPQRVSLAFLGATAAKHPTNAMAVPMLPSPSSMNSPLSPTVTANSSLLSSTTSFSAQPPDSASSDASASQPTPRSSVLPSFTNDFDDFDDFQAPASAHSLQSAFADFSMTPDQSGMGSFTQFQSMPSISAASMSSMGGLLTGISSTSEQPKPTSSSSGTSLVIASSEGGLPTGAAQQSGQARETIGFDDFDDFVSSPLRSPSPPRVPVKPQAASLTASSSSGADIDALWPSVTTPSSTPSRMARRMAPPPTALPLPPLPTSFRGLGSSELPASPDNEPSFGLRNRTSTSRLGPPLPMMPLSGSLLPVSSAEPAAQRDGFDFPAVLSPPKTPSAFLSPASPPSSARRSAVPSRVAEIKLDGQPSSLTLPSMPAPAPTHAALPTLPPPLTNTSSGAPPKIALLPLSASSIRDVAPGRPAPHGVTGYRAHHNVTLGLVESASSRQGTWPAPRSPLPMALAPPPGDTRRMAPVQDMFDFSEDIAQPVQQPQTASEFTLLDASTQSTSPTSKAPLSSVIPSVPSTKGGLSTQDLMFFEN